MDPSSKPPAPETAKPTQSTKPAAAAKVQPVAKAESAEKTTGAAAGKDEGEKPVAKSVAKRTRKCKLNVPKKNAPPELMVRGKTCW